MDRHPNFGVLPLERRRRQGFDARQLETEVRQTVGTHRQRQLCAVVGRLRIAQGVLGIDGSGQLDQAVEVGGEDHFEPHLFTGSERSGHHHLADQKAAAATVVTEGHREIFERRGAAVVHQQAEGTRDTHLAARGVGHETARHHLEIGAQAQQQKF